MKLFSLLGTRRRAAVGIATVTLVLAAGCSGKSAEPPKEPAIGAAAAPASATPAAAIMVNVAEVVAKDITKSVEVTGSLVALNDVTVGSNQAGRVISVAVHEGDQVSAGQIVATMDTADLRQQVMSAQANIEAARTREAQARAQLRQASTAVTNSQTTAGWTDKTTQSAIASAQAALSQSEEKLAVVKAGARDQEKRQAEEQVKAAKANLDKAKADLKRYQALYKEQAISGLQLDQAQAAADSAQANYQSAVEGLSLIREGARPEDIRAAEQAVTQSRRALERAQADREQLSMRKGDIESARAGVDVARAGMLSAQAAVRQAAAALEITIDAVQKASVKSPISGYVAARLAEPGQQLGSGAAIMRIVSPKTVYLQAVLPESQYSSVRPGLTATVSVDAIPGVTIQGRVSRILPVASAAARSFSVRIDFAADARHRPEMFARASILIDTHRRASLVPKDAVIFDPVSDRNRVFVTLKDGKAEERVVKLGYIDPSFVEVISGVQVGEKVITAGQSTLQNGDKVNVQ